MNWLCSLTIIIGINCGFLMAELHSIDKSLATIAANTKQPIQLQIAGFSPEAQQAMDAALQPKGKKK